MLPLLLGCGVLLVLLATADGFRRASVPTGRVLAGWIAILGALSLGTLLLLTGRWQAAIGLGVMAGLATWGWHRPAARPAARPGVRPGARPSARPRTGPGAAPSRRDGAMGIEEAMEVLGLAGSVSDDEIRQAHRRLMRGVHPDTGGSDWLAARVNQARDVLLRKNRSSRI